MKSHQLLVVTRTRYLFGYPGDARYCANLVIERDDVSADNRALALAYKAEADLAIRGRDADIDARKMYEEALDNAGDPKYRIRVLRSYAKFLMGKGGHGAWNAAQEAYEIARDNGLQDQMRKARALRGKIAKGKHLKAAT
jgi:hypothetical protein